MTTTVVGLFDDMFHAQSAVADLQSLGVPQTDISVVANETIDTVSPTAAIDESGSAAAAGAETGAVLGGATGLVLGLAAIAVPGVGPVFAAGPILATLSGALLGAATGGIIGALVDIGVPETEAGYYAEGIRRGGSVVTAHVAPHLSQQAADAMRSNGAVDIHDRVSFWREAGWSKYDPAAPRFTPEEAARERATWTTRNPSRHEAIDQEIEERKAA